jgi:hypothetical protein
MGNSAEEAGVVAVGYGGPRRQAGLRRRDGSLQQLQLGEIGGVQPMRWGWRRQPRRSQHLARAACDCANGRAAYGASGGVAAITARIGCECVG